MSKKYILAWSFIAMGAILLSIFQMTQASGVNSVTQNNDCGPLSQEAEQGQLSGAMQIGQDSNASGGQYVAAPRDTEGSSSITGNSDKVEFCVLIPEDGDYQIQARVHARSAGNNSMFVAVGGLPSAGYLWDMDVNERYVQDMVSDRNQNDPQTISLTAGAHTLTFANRESDTRLDSFEMIRVGGGSSPTATPVPVSEPTAVPTSQPINLPAEGSGIGQCVGHCVILPFVFVSNFEAPPTPTPGEGAPIGGPSPVSCGDLIQEAENGELFGRMAIISDGNVTAISGNDAENASLVMADRADYCVTINQPGDYTIAANVKSSSFGSNSMFWTLDGSPASGMVWHMNVSNGYSLQTASSGGNPEGGNGGREVYLEAGDHIISFYHREPGVALDRIEVVSISDDAPAPGGSDPIDSELGDYNFPLIDYSNVGLGGGIPNYPNEIRVTGWSQSDIERAINSAQPFTRIILPAGTYNIGTLKITKSNVALVGEGNGCGETILKFGGQDTGILIGNNGSLGSSVNLAINAGRNSKSITVSDGGGFNVGDYVMVRQNDDSELFRADLSRNPDEDWVLNNATQMNKIISKNGNTLILEGGLNLDYKTSLNARVTKVNNMISGVGIENLTLERTSDDSAASASANIYMTYAANSWVQGVHTKNSVRAHIFLSRSYKSEIRGNYLDASFNNGSGGHGYGVRLQGGTTDVLVENNIARLMRHSYIAQIGANGNVFGYNYSADPYGEGFGEIYTDLSVHGGFGHSNLFEGNQAQHAKIDNIHASNSWNLFFRNRLEQDIDNYTYKNELMSKGETTPHIWVHENQYYNTFLANEIGFPGANPATQAVGFSDGRTRDNFTVCKFTNSSDGERGCGRTRETTLIHGTHDFLTGETTWDSSIGATSFPASAYKSQKPSFWGSTAWPTFGPDTLNQNEANKIVPAKSRFLAAQQGNGSFCYLGR
ncbi:MAG: hypothetical protein AB8G95_05475 [Anaerolineae bacterium]